MKNLFLKVHNSTTTYMWFLHRRSMWLTVILPFVLIIALSLFGSSHEPFPNDDIVEVFTLLTMLVFFIFIITALIAKFKTWKNFFQHIHNSTTTYIWFLHRRSMWLTVVLPFIIVVGSFWLLGYTPRDMEYRAILLNSVSLIYIGLFVLLSTAVTAKFITWLSLKFNFYLRSWLTIGFWPISILMGVATVLVLIAIGYAIAMLAIFVCCILFLMFLKLGGDDPM